jgi:hypothetical protein
VKKRSNLPFNFLSAWIGTKSKYKKLIGILLPWVRETLSHMCGFCPLSQESYMHLDEINLVNYTCVLFWVIMFYYSVHHIWRNFVFAAPVFTSEGNYSILIHNVRLLVNYFLLIRAYIESRPSCYANILERIQNAVLCVSVGSKYLVIINQVLFRTVWLRN